MNLNIDTLVSWIESLGFYGIRCRYVSGDYDGKFYFKGPSGENTSLSISLDEKLNSLIFHMGSSAFSQDLRYYRYNADVYDIIRLVDIAIYRVGLVGEEKELYQKNKSNLIMSAKREQKLKELGV